MMKINLQKKKAEALVRKARRENFEHSIKWGVVVTLLVAASLLATLHI